MADLGLMQLTPRLGMPMGTRSLDGMCLTSRLVGLSLSKFGGIQNSDEYQEWVTVVTEDRYTVSFLCTYCCCGSQCKYHDGHHVDEPRIIKFSLFGEKRCSQGAVILMRNI